MFYVCDKKGDKYGIMDSTDNIVEYYTAKEIVSIIKNYNIAIEGVNTKDGKVSIKVANRLTILTEAELNNLYCLVDSSGYWQFPNARKQREKAENLINNGYILVVNNTEMTLQAFNNKVENELKVAKSSASSCYVKYYSDIFEYEDTRNKVYYIKLGDLQFANLT